MSDKSYVSMLRIDGKPILPPLVTPSLRAELLKYREQAVLKERNRASKWPNHSSVKAVTNDNDKATVSQQIPADSIAQPHEHDQDTSNGENLPILPGLLAAGQGHFSATASCAFNVSERREESTISSSVNKPSESTDLNLDNFSCTPRSDCTTTIGESLAQITVSAELETASKSPIQEEEISPSKRPVYVRSASFVVETPSQLSNSRPVIVTRSTSDDNSTSRSITPTAATPHAKADRLDGTVLSPRQMLLNASPAISDKLTRLLAGDTDESIATETDNVEQATTDLKEMEQTLRRYHELQLEELRLRQEEEFSRLRKQLSGVENISKSKGNCCLNNASETSDLPVTSSTCQKSSMDQTTMPKSPHMALTLSGRLKAKLFALISGYLVRRTMQTDRLLELKNTVEEIRTQLVALNSSRSSWTADDTRFHTMITSQTSGEVILASALAEIHIIFCEWPAAKRMKLIERQRIVEEAAHMKKLSKSVTRRLSSATSKTLARKGMLQVPAAEMSRKKSPRVLSNVKSKRRLTMVARSPRHRSSHASASKSTSSTSAHPSTSNGVRRHAPLSAKPPTPAASSACSGSARRALHMPTRVGSEQRSLHGTSSVLNTTTVIRKRPQPWK